MAPRSYLTHKQAASPRLASQPQARPASPTPERRIPLDAKLHSLKTASSLLNEQFDGGYSTREMRRLIGSGQWQQGWHYIRRGTRIKVYLPAVQEWQLG